MIARVADQDSAISPDRNAPGRREAGALGRSIISAATSYASEGADQTIRTDPADLGVTLIADEHIPGGIESDAGGAGQR